MSGQARIEHLIPEHDPEERPVHAQAARDWLGGPDVQDFLTGLRDPAKGIPDHAAGRHVHVTVEWA